MFWIVAILSLLLAASLAANFFFVPLALKLSDFATRFEENYSTAQDALQKLFNDLVTVMTIPIIENDHTARQIISRVKFAQIEVLRVARLISMQDDEDAEEKKKTADE